MANELPRLTVKAIGIVRNDIKQSPGPGYDWRKIVSDIVIDSGLSEALDGLEDFFHTMGIFWMHNIATSGQVPTKLHHQGRQELPLVALFATRSPHRPNPTGKTTARLLQRRGNILRIEGLDAIDDTPVIDIKPYIPGSDAATDAEVPSWIAKL